MKQYTKILKQMIRTFNNNIKICGSTYYTVICLI